MGFTTTRPTVESNRTTHGGVMSIREILNALRAGIVTTLIIALVNMILLVGIYGLLKPKTQEYIHPYNGQPVPEFVIIDGELPD